jgi:hypothetical protein
MRESKRSAYPRLGADNRVTLPRAICKCLGAQADDIPALISKAAKGVTRHGRDEPGHDG